VEDKSFKQYIGISDLGLQYAFFEKGKLEIFHIYGCGQEIGLIVGKPILN
jgi:hypothetical protein